MRKTTNHSPALRALIALPIVEKFYVVSIGLALITAIVFCFVGVLPQQYGWGKILFAMACITMIVGLIGKHLDFVREKDKKGDNNAE